MNSNEGVVLSGLQNPNFQLIDQNLADVQKYTNSTFEEGVDKLYDEQAVKYEFILKDCVGYADPDMVAEMTETVKLPTTLSVIDFGCGTGLAGQSLSKKGFSDFTGLDASSGMLLQAQQKNLYKKLEERFCGNGPLPEPFRNQFDLAVSSGAFLPKHLPPVTFDEMIDAIKPGGGWLIFTIRDSYLHSEGFNQKLQELIDKGTIKFERKISWFKYEGMEGEKSYGVFQKDICHVICYKVNK